MSQLRFWDGQSWTTATASPPVMQAPVAQAPTAVLAPVYEDPSAGGGSEQPKPPRSGRGSRFYASVAGVALVAVIGAIVVEVVTRPHRDDSSAVPSAVTPAQHDARYDAATKSDVKDASLAEETYFTDNDIYTTDGQGAPGSETGPLQGFTKSAGSVSITFSLFGTQSYMIVAVSKSGRLFCFNSARSGAGVVAASTC